MTPNSLAPGTVVANKYRIERVLGRGGMGVVVAAEHLHLRERVALKFLLSEVTSVPGAADRFLREARAAMRLGGEHVARVFDSDVLDDGTPYMVLEYLEGEDLGALLTRRGPLPAAEAVGYVLEACEGLATAHAAGIVHRDLKPANLFLARGKDGVRRVKVLDFGIAKSADGFDGATTATGVMLGSPSYMSPEQLMAPASVDTRSDVWALGVVLFELVAGVLPFEGTTVAEICALVLTQRAPPLRRHRSGLPKGFGKAVRRCLQKDPAERYADVGELARSLAPFGDARAGERAANVARALHSQVSLAPPEFAATVPAGGVRNRAAASNDEPTRADEPALAAFEPPGSGTEIAPSPPHPRGAATDVVATTSDEGVGAEAGPDGRTVVPSTKSRWRSRVLLGAMALVVGTPVVAYAHHVYSTRLSPLALTRRLLACEFGSAPACLEAGESFEYGTDGAKDVARAAERYRQACEKGAPRGCSQFAFMLANGKGVAKDDARALALEKRACSADDATGCVRLGWRFINGEVVLHDEKRGFELVKASCARDGVGRDDACNELGLLYEKGVGTDVDATQAGASFARACDLGSAFGCANTGLTTLGRHKHTTDEDEVEAASFFRKACERRPGNGVAFGCWQYCRSLVGEVGASATDRERAGEVCRAACEAGDEKSVKACFLMGRLVEDGDVRGVDRNQAAAWYRKGCAGGDEQACGEVGRVESP